MDSTQILEKKIDEKTNVRVLVLVDNLCLLSFFPLMRICLKMKPITIYYFKASRFGLWLAFLFKVITLASGNPRKIKELILTDIPQNGVSESRFKVFEACIKNQHRIDKLVEKYIPKLSDHFRKICAIGVRKQWQLWLEKQLNVFKVGKIYSTSLC